MAKASGRSRSGPLESAEYSDAWARGILATGKMHVRKALEDYKRIAADKRLTEADREVARQRAKALARLL